MALLVPGVPGSQPLLGYLVGGFALLVIGLALLTRRRGAPVPIESKTGTLRALAWVAIYGLCASSFARILAPALLGQERSPWLLALGDVIFVTVGLFVWVLWLAEGRPWRAYGFHGAPPTRLALTMVLGIGAALFFSARAYLTLASGLVQITADSLVFATLFAVVGSALPEELLFRGYLQSSLDRFNRWGRLAIPALAFTAVRSLRYLPGSDLSPVDWLFYVLGVAFPLGLWWGLMRDLAGGSLWPSLVSHAVLEFGSVLAHSSSEAAVAPL